MKNEIIILIGMIMFFSLLLFLVIIEEFKKWRLSKKILSRARY